MAGGFVGGAGAADASEVGLFTAAGWVALPLLVRLVMDLLLLVRLSGL